MQVHSDCSRLGCDRAERALARFGSELADVRDAMRTRGFLRSPAHVLAHPLATLEFGVVPMVFRSLTIADELDVPGVDPRERFLDGGDPRALNADDGIHLSEAGYRLFYRTLIEQISVII